MSFAPNVCQLAHMRPVGTGATRSRDSPGHRVRPHLHRLGSSVEAVDAALQREPDAAVHLDDVGGDIAARPSGPGERIAREARLGIRGRPRGEQAAHHVRAQRRQDGPGRREARRAARRTARARSRGRAPPRPPRQPARRDSRECTAPQAWRRAAPSPRACTSVRRDAQRAGAVERRLRARRPDRAEAERSRRPVERPTDARPAPWRARPATHNGAPSVASSTTTEWRDSATELDRTGDDRAEQLAVLPQRLPPRGRESIRRARRRARPTTSRTPARAVGLPVPIAPTTDSAKRECSAATTNLIGRRSPRARSPCRRRVPARALRRRLRRHSGSRRDDRAS